ncbi:MAG TPA: DUF2809 domain-containing protein [Acidobacteriaceae bacterium]|jgi:hypothetical protein|nr:DUF2809 domain-containing protein [Acidobacteriaceae bacterium]
MSRRAAYLLIAVVTLVVGLVWRFVLTGLPPFLYKYGGSVLWAAMIYWLAAVVRPQAKPVRLAVIATAIATAVELFKLVHTPALDAFRLTFAGKVLLGRFFYWSDFVAYYLAIALTALVDQSVRTRTR